MRLPGRNQLPAELRRSFAADERSVAVADSAASVVVATQYGLWISAEGISDSTRTAVATPAGWRRIGWQDIVKATWSEAGLQVIPGVTDADGMIDDVAPMLLRLTVPRDLPAVVKQRVESSIARWEQIRVPGGTARLIARRRPGQDGLVWTARIDSDTAVTSAVRAVALAHLDQARATSIG